MGSLSSVLVKVLVLVLVVFWLFQCLTLLEAVILTVLGNVHDKRAGYTSERDTLYYSTTTILNCNTTRLSTNYNYIRNS